MAKLVKTTRGKEMGFLNQLFKKPPKKTSQDEIAKNYYAGKTRAAT